MDDPFIFKKIWSVKSDPATAEGSPSLNFEPMVFWIHWTLTVLVADKAAFHMNGLVNRYDLRQYAPRYHPHENSVYAKISRKKVSVWVGLCGNWSLIVYIFLMEILIVKPILKSWIKKSFQSYILLTESPLILFGGCKMALLMKYSNNE